MKLSDVEVWEQYLVKILKKRVALENLDDNADIHKGLEKHYREYNNFTQRLKAASMLS